MNTLTAHRAAERFAQLVDVDVPSQIGADVPSQIGADVPPVFLDGGDPSMRPAVVVTAALRAAARTASPAPLSAEARMAMRERLVAAASGAGEASALAPGLATRVSETAQRSQERAKSAAHRMRRRVSAVVGSVVMVTSVAGVGVAAARSLPGSPFYDLKRATEDVQLWLSSGPAAKGERHLEFARTRLAEARALGGSSRYVSSALRSMNEQTRAGTSDLIAAYRSSGDREPLADLVVFTREQYASLERFGETIPVQLQAQTFYSMTLLVGVAQDVRSISGTQCLTCLLTGAHPHSTPAPGSKHSPNPAPSGSTPGSAPAPSKSSLPGHGVPTGIVPTHLPSGVPTKLPTLPALLPRHNGQKAKAVPTVSPLPVLSTLKRVFSAK